MSPTSSLDRFASLRTLLRMAVIAVSLGALTSDDIRGSAQSAPIFGPATWNEKRGSFSMLPFEQIDMVTGELSLTFEDLVLPGNAGMDLRIVRSSGGGGLGFGLGGVPVAVSPAVCNVVQPYYPVLYFVGSAQPTVPESNITCDDVFLTSDFFRYRHSTRTLSMSNGWTVTYHPPASPGEKAYLAEVRDVFGNTITASWETVSGVGRMTAVTQATGGYLRNVSLSYDAQGSGRTIPPRVRTNHRRGVAIFRRRVHFN